MGGRGYLLIVHTPYNQGKLHEARALKEEGSDIAIPWRGPGNRESALTN